MYIEDLISHLLTPTQLAEESNALTVLPHLQVWDRILYYTHDFLYVVRRVSVSRKTLQCRVRHFTPTHDMTKALQKLLFILFQVSVSDETVVVNNVYTYDSNLNLYITSIEPPSITVTRDVVLRVNGNGFNKLHVSHQIMQPKRFKWQ